MSFIDLMLGALLALTATSVGALGVLLFKQKTIEKNRYAIMLAFSAGVMSFSVAEMLGQSHAMSGDITAMSGVASGVALLFVLERTLPHAHVGVKGPEYHARRKSVLIAGSITVHNIPEGFAIAAAFANSSPLGWLVTTSIAAQDVPEGLLVSTPLACYGLQTRKCVKYGVLSGVVEASAAIIGYLFLSVIAWANIFALAFSSGAMLYVIVEELLPDALRNGKRRTVALSFICGILTAFALATALGF